MEFPNNSSEEAPKNFILQYSLKVIKNKGEIKCPTILTNAPMGALSKLKIV